MEFMLNHNMVIKAKYGDTLRRFSVPINRNGQLHLDMAGLRGKILGLFDFALDTEIVLTYIDEDEDVVTLVNDDDLVDIMKQRLKCVKIDVQLKEDKFAKSSSGASTPMRASPIPLCSLDPGAAEVLKSLPEPFRGVLTKLSTELAKKAASSNPAVAEVVDCLSKLLNPTQRSGAGASSSTNGGVGNPTASGVPETAQEANAAKGVSSAPFRPIPSHFDLPLHTNSVPPPHIRPFNVDNLKESMRRNMKGSVRQPIYYGAPFNTFNSMKPFGGECPISGMPMTSNTFPSSLPFPQGYCPGDSTLGMFHKGVQCDGCGVLPITGPRYKSKVREDFDLCSVCFVQMGNEADYNKMDRPVPYRHPRKGLADPVMKQSVLNAFRANKLDSRFILDVNVFDGTMMAASTPFTKIWRLRNCGRIAWPQGSRLLWIGGDKISEASCAEIDICSSGFPVDGELDIAVDFVAPKLSGRYLSYWRMADPSGVKFGQRVWVLINVVDSMKDPASDGVQGFNLNMPPECSGTKSPEIVNMNGQPARHIGIDRYTTPPTVFVPMKPEVDAELPEKEQELNFPINNSLLVGDGLSAPASSMASPSMSSPVASPSVSSPVASPCISYPVVDLSEAGPSEAVAAVDIPTSSEEADNLHIETTLLKELEEMGFRQIDLNKEILRSNEYNLEQSVDELCGVSEWDPILEELQEMGFENDEMNRKLLKKNNGSIKGVVMDLLTGGEKA